MDKQSLWEYLDMLWAAILKSLLVAVVFGVAGSYSFLGTYQIYGKRENMSAAFLYADDQVTGNGAGL